MPDIVMAFLMVRSDLGSDMPFASEYLVGATAAIASTEIWASR
jgi:hypothetical protein